MHYLIYGHGGSYNHGCEAIVRCTIALLRETSPGCYITLSTHFPEQDRAFALPADEFVTRDISGKTNIEIYKPVIDKITSDTICIHTGGDNYCYKNWQRYAEIHYAAIKRGAKSIFWGCSIDPDVIDEEMLNALRSHHLVIARESMTYDALIANGLTNAVKISDIAFALAPKPVEFDLNNYVVLNFSPLVCRKNPLVKDEFLTLADYILRETDLNIALVPHVLMPMDNDYDVLKELDTQDTNRVKLVSDSLSAAEYKYIVSKAEMCVAARTHATIAAYSSHVPTLAVGYSVKAAGIARDLWMSEYVLSLDDITTSESLIPVFEKLMDKTAQVQETLRKNVPTPERVEEGYRKALEYICKQKEVS